MREKYWTIHGEPTFAELIAITAKMSGSAKGIAFYLRLRNVQGDGPATLAEIEEDMGVSRRTLERTMPELRRSGLVVEAQPVMVPSRVN